MCAVFPSPALTITTAGHNRGLGAFCLIRIYWTVESVLVWKDKSPAHTNSLEKTIDHTIWGCNSKTSEGAWRWGKHPEAQQVFLFSSGISGDVCAEMHRHSQRNTDAIAYSCNSLAVADSICLLQFLPFIQSTTWLELHLLTGSITSAMVEVCLVHAWQKKNTPKKPTHPLKC